MKKIASILFIIIFIWTTGCADASTKEASIEYSIYLGGSDLAGITADETKSSILKVAGNIRGLPADCDFSFVHNSAPDNINAPQSKSFTINGKSYQLSYVRSTESSLANSSNEALKKYGRLDVYSTSDFDFEFSQDSGEFRFYGDYETDYLAEGNFTAEEAIAASQSVLTELFGAKCFEYYDTPPTVSNSVTQTSNIFVVTYRKYIEGYRTRDFIQLRYNKQGVLVCINAKSYGIMESVIDRYSATQFQSAEKFITDYLDSISCDYDRDSITLEINSNGECYFELYGTYSIGDEYRMRAFYVNVD